MVTILRVTGSEKLHCKLNIGLQRLSKKKKKLAACGLTPRFDSTCSTKTAFLVITITDDTT